MKTYLLIFTFIFTIITCAQNPFDKTITLKTNLVSLFNISLELPIYKRFSTEFSFREFEYWEDMLINYHIHKKTLRFNVKYHIPNNNHKEDYTNYIFTGLNSCIISYEKKYKDYQLFDAKRITLGVGQRMRLIDVWVSIEKNILTHYNFEKSFDSVTGNPIYEKWKPNIYVSGGIAINIVNINLNKEKH